MKPTNRTLTTIAATLVAALAGCTAQPTLESATTTPVAPAQATTVAANAAADTSTTTAQGAARVDGAAVPEAKKKAPSGFRVKRRKGRELYCREESTVGTRFTEQMCYTREQLDAIAEQNDRSMGELERGRSVCSNPSFCGGPT